MKITDAQMSADTLHIETLCVAIVDSPSFVSCARKKP